LQAANDTAVFSPTSPGEFVVDLTREEPTTQTLGIDLYGVAATVLAPSAVFVQALSPDGLAAGDGRLRAGELQQLCYTRTARKQRGTLAFSVSVGNTAIWVISEFLENF